MQKGKGEPRKEWSGNLLREGHLLEHLRYVTGAFIRTFTVCDRLFPDTFRHKFNANYLL